MNDTPASNIWIFLEVLARRRGLIIGLVVASTIAAVIISLFMPKWYAATASLLPPPDDSGSGLAQLAAPTQPISGASRAPGMITQNDVYARILRSRRISDRVIDRFGLKELWGMQTSAAIYKELSSRVNVSVADEGLLEISVEDRDPQKAADLATAYVEELIKLNRELLSASAKEKREFIEDRLEEVTEQLDSSRDVLQKFQLDNRAVNFDQQTRLAIEQASSLKVSQAKLQLDISMAKRELGAENPVLQDKIRRLRFIEQQLNKLEWGGDDSSFFSLPVSAVPSLKGKFELLSTRVRVNESLYRSLLDLLEKARISEKEHAPTISVLDWPTVPELKSRPKRSIIVIGTFVLTLVFAVLLALVLEYLRRMRESQNCDYRRLLLFTHAFLGWLPGVKKPVDR